MAPENGTTGPANSEKMCPLLGMVVVPVVVQSSIARPGDPEVQMQIKFNVCVKEKCMLWDGPKRDCTLKLGAEAAIALRSVVDEHKGKLSLLSMFGKKKE